jgi:hypothetical protein
VADDSLARLYLRALTPKRAPRAVPEAWTAPSVSRALVPVDAEHLRRYRRLCGFPDGPTLPPTYPHLTAFPMGMALLTRREFPYPVLGLVHIRNEIEQLRPIAQTETLDYHVWSSSSSYLRRTAAASRPSSNPAIDSRDGAGAATATAVPSSTVAWRLPADLGRRYAALSGDRNPIHLYPWTARLFGFRRQIAHGMWSAARCLAALNAPGTATKAETETATETELTFTVDLRAAVLLPSEVALATARGVDGTTEFCLTSAGGDRTHLTGRLVFAP